MIIRDIMPLAESALVNDQRVLVVTGMRRTGKSTLVRQLAEKRGNYCLFNFEDERLQGFNVEHFPLLEEALFEEYGRQEVLFFDEIQNIPRFEIAVRRLQDNGKKIVLTGSNSSMLSMEFGSRLTGRYKQLELYPFSFGEFLRFRNVPLPSRDIFLPEEKLSFLQLFLTYMEGGGLPESLLYGDPDYIRTLFDNILFRDIIVRYGIRNHKEFRELVRLLASNLSLPVTYSSLQRTIGLSNSETVKEYMGYLSNAYVFYELLQYHDSLKKQFRNPRKVYINDPAFHSLVGFSSSLNLGRKLENTVYLVFRRSGKQIFSFKEKGECDFVVREPDSTFRLYQVCYQLSAENETRELTGLLEAMEKFGLQEGMIITYDQELQMARGGKKISLIPVWKWMLGLRSQES
jgi:predicted AAA+ superfamily ATPase